MEKNEIKQNNKEEGATMVEYALMVSLIAVICIVAVQLIGTQASAKFNEAGVAIQGN